MFFLPLSLGHYFRNSFFANLLSLPLFNFIETGEKYCKGNCGRGKNTIFICGGRNKDSGNKFEVVLANTEDFKDRYYFWVTFDQF